MPTEYDVGIVTLIGRNVCHVEWKIENYFSRRQISDMIWTSPMFQMLNVAWYLSLHPKGPSWPDTIRWIGLFLRYESKPRIHPAAYMMGIKRGDGSVYSFVEGPGSVRWHFGNHQLLEHSELLRQKDIIASDGHVTFFVTICFSDINPSSVEIVASESSENGREESSEEDDVYESEIDGMFVWQSENDDSNTEEICLNTDRRHLKNLSRDFKHLLLSGEDSDAKIRVKNRRFDVHRAILSARSQVFASMFRHDMVERKEGVVDIVDCDPDAFGVFLMFLYTGRAEKISSDTVLDLYAAAAKYDVEDLRELCVEYMQRKMSVDLFCDVMDLAITYSDDKLIKYATNFFIGNAVGILPTVRWQHFLTEKPVEANELYMKALKKEGTMDTDRITQPNCTLAIVDQPMSAVPVENLNVAS